MKKQLVTGILTLLMSSASFGNADNKIADLIGSGNPLNSGNTVIRTEAEPNGTTVTARVLNNDLTSENIYNVLLNGNLSNASDLDYCRINLSNDSRLALKFNILDINYQEITNATYDTANNRFILVADSKTVLAGPIADPTNMTRLFSEEQLIGLVPGPAAETLAIADIAVASNGTIILTINDRAEVITIAADGTAVVALDEATITAFTGEINAVIQSVTTDSDTIYLAEQSSGAILALDNDFETISFHISPATMQEALITDLHHDIDAMISSTPQTVMAKAVADTFSGTSMIYVEAGGLYAEGFFISQFGTIGSGGDGGITYMYPDENDPENAVITKLFDPGDDENLLKLNPTALAIAANNDIDFNERIYFGTFGPTMGDDMDGEVYMANVNGTISKFATQFVDEFGAAAIRGGQPITGFYDVIDIAFSPAAVSPFGNYLYVISENGYNDYYGTGRASDLWRVDKNGKAHMFVESLMNYAGSLAFDTSGNYDNALFVASWDTATIMKIDASGNASTFYSSDEIGGILDIAFSPVDSLFAGNLTFTVRSGSVTRLVTIDPDGNTSVWAANLPTGDVPSGDITFDANGDLYVLNSDNNGVSRIEYQDLHNYTLGQMRIRTVNDIETPYVLVSIADQPRIVRVAADNVDDVATEANPSFIDVGTVPDDGSKNITFDFAPDGEMFAYIRNADAFAKSPRSEENNTFDQWVSMAGSFFENEFDLTDIQVKNMFFGSGYTVYWVAGNGPGDDPENLPSQDKDDILLSFTAINEDNEPDDFQTLVTVKDLTKMQVDITGPDNYSESFVTDIDQINEKLYENLEAGNYYIAVSSIAGASGDYELLAEVGGVQQDLEITADNSPLELINVNNETIKITFIGKGNAVLKVLKRPASDKISNFLSMEIQDSTSSTEVTIENIDNPNVLTIENLILNNSMKSLVVDGDVNTITGMANKTKTIKSISVNDVEEIMATNYKFSLFTAENIGDKDAEVMTKFDVLALSELVVYGDIDNTEFFDIDHKNYFKLISVQGIVNNSQFSGASIKAFEILNIQDEPIAMDSSMIYVNKTIYQVTVGRGNIDGSVISANKKVGSVAVLDGDLINSQIRAVSYLSSSIGEVLVYNGLQDNLNQDTGNISNSTITTRKSIKTIYASGAIDSDTYITASGARKPKISRIASGGDNASRTTASDIKEVLVGFDRSYKRIAESSAFTGSDFTGSITVSYNLKELNVTGKITDAQILGSYKLGSIFAEDGFDANVQTVRDIKKIMIGFIDGKRSKVSEYIDKTGNSYTVDGSISAQKCSSLYYVGKRKENMSLPLKCKVVKIEP
ncbi:MAG: hypothetical protein JEZ07_12790 [Phycisphaerae bacterium]|nr:hypothetical protein [Phycisphaerae bacterium]